MMMNLIEFINIMAIEQIKWWAGIAQLEKRQTEDLKVVVRLIPSTLTALFMFFTGIECLWAGWTSRVILD